MNDKHRAETWSREHWHLAVFACLCLPVVGAVLVQLDVITERRAWLATGLGVAYILAVTWYYTRRRKPNEPSSNE